jgi:hypothetical protein
MFCTSRPGLLLACALALGTTLAWPVYAEDASQPKANVSIHISGTSRTGGSGANQSTATHTLAVGQSTVVGVHADFEGAIGSGGWPVGGVTSHAWRVEARLLAVNGEAVEVSVTWRRYAPGARGELAGSGDTRVLKLTVDERHVLDLVHSDDPTSDLANIVVEVEARRAEEPAERIVWDYDFWLVHERAKGGKTTEHQSRGGFQGESTPVAFTPLSFGLNGEAMPQGGDGPIGVSVGIRVAGRRRPDGNIDVTLGTEAWLACGQGRGGGSGVKGFVAREGETVSVEVPLAMGACTLDGVHAAPPGTKRGVTDTPAGLRVSSREFFEGDRLSLLVTVRRIR